MDGGEGMGRDVARTSTNGFLSEVFLGSVLIASEAHRNDSEAQLQIRYSYRTHFRYV
jgi:hypothetical protein